MLSEAHNIGPLRNQFQMLFVTNIEVGSFGVGQEGRVSRDLHRRPLLSPGFKLFPSSVKFVRRGPIEVAPYVHKWGVGAFVRPIRILLSMF